MDQESQHRVQAARGGWGVACVCVYTYMCVQSSLIVLVGGASAVPLWLVVARSFDFSGQARNLGLYVKFPGF